jgi:hypothetical protein
VIPSQSEKQLRRTSSFERRLKEKLSIQRQHLDELDKHIKELEKDSGGEQH